MSSILEMFGSEKHINPHYNIKAEKKTKDEMKNKISLALKDPILQQGFEIICKNLAELENENEDLKEDNGKLNKSVELLKEELLNPKDKCYSKYKDQLTKAKEIINGLLSFVDSLGNYSGGIFAKAEQFLSEVEK